MKKLKIYVYAICKNESTFIPRWVESLKDADGIYVLDTGSTDDSVELLKKEHVHVFEEKIDPWRFDVARNRSLEFVPKNADICICTDLDEVFSSNWRKSLEELWLKEKPTRVKYLFHWSLDEFDQPKVTFYLNKIHQRNGYQWSHPVHEVLVANDITEKEVITSDFYLNHYPDATKSRGSYLPLLEMSVLEDPEDDRNMHYLGREYMYYGKYQKCIETLHRHLELKSATWKDERCASMRFMARSYKALHCIEEARMWFQKSVTEAPYLREGYVEWAILEYEMHQYQIAYQLLKSALRIENKSDSYINEIFAWDYSFYDYLSLCAFQLNLIDEACIYAKMAWELNEHDERLKNNYHLLEKMVSETSK